MSGDDISDVAGEDMRLLGFIDRSFVVRDAHERIDLPLQLTANERFVKSLLHPPELAMGARLNPINR